MYGSMLCNESDIVYVNTLIREILQSVYRDPASEIHLGTEQIPTPPANVGKVPSIKDKVKRNPFDAWMFIIIK